MGSGTRKIVIDALKGSKKGVAASGSKTDPDGRRPVVLIGQDNVFETPIVYVYGPIDLYLEIRKRLYSQDEENLVEAKGYCSFGTLRSGDDSLVVGIVWANWKWGLQEAMPTFVHELSHAVDDIIEHAGVTDKSGESKAYFMESEFAFLLKRLYNMKMRKARTDLVKEALNGLIETDNKDCANRT